MQSKGKVIVEPTGSQADFEAAKQQYQDKIEEDGNCILLAVFRGKMSEGISFNDDFARCVSSCAYLEICFARSVVSNFPV